MVSNYLLHAYEGKLEYKYRFTTGPDGNKCLEEIRLLVYFTCSFTDQKRDKGRFGTDPDVITCLEEIILLVYFTRSFTDLKKGFSANKRQIWDWSRCHYMSLRDHIACYNPAHTM